MKVCVRSHLLVHTGLQLSQLALHCPFQSTYYAGTPPLTDEGTTGNDY